VLVLAALVLEEPALVAQLVVHVEVALYQEQVLELYQVLWL